MAKKNEETKRMMDNVMAALNSAGVVYSPQYSGIGQDLNRSVAQLKARAETINFGGEKFDQKWKEFISLPGYYSPQGEYWADDNQYVLVSFYRMNKFDEEALYAYATLCGYNDVETALWKGEVPARSYRRINVRVEKIFLGAFLKKVAKDCW